MKFTVKHIGKSGRLGNLMGVDKRQGETFTTPLLAIYTRGGNVPHITHEVLQMITTDNLIMHMPLTTVMSAVSSIESFGRGLSEFVGMKEYPSYVTPQDPAVQTPAGYNISDKIAVWTKKGKRTVDPQSYMTMIENMKPDMYLALCDGDTDSASSKKRVMKSMARTSSLFKECFKLHQASNALRHTAILAPIEGGYDINARRAFTDEIAGYDVSGYVFDGFHTNGPEAESITFESIEAVATVCLERLPKDKLRVMHGAWSPTTLLQLVAAGFDVFDTSLPYICSERSGAFTFPYNEGMVNSILKIIPEEEKKSVQQKYEICLEDDIHKEDFQPVLKACSCLTCRHHTRAYIYHLLKSHELLGKVLLMMHNLHHYLEFFKSIRKAIHNDTLDSLCTLVKSHRAC